VGALGEQTGVRLTFIDPNGCVLADSEQTSLAAVEALDNHRHRPEVQQALQQGFGFTDRYSTTLQEPLIYYAARVDGTDGPLGVARSALPLESISRRARRGRAMVGLFAMVLAVIAIAGMSSLLHASSIRCSHSRGRLSRWRPGTWGSTLRSPTATKSACWPAPSTRLNDDLLARLDQIRERGDQLAAVLGGMVEGVIAVDRRTRIMFANDAAGKQFDFRADQAHGRPLLSLIRDETLHQSVQHAMTSRTSVNAEIERHVPSSGTMAVHATPLPGEPCPGVVVVLYDMTQLRRLESMRQEFVANVSHELKTPLSSIKAYAETLRAGAINDQRHNLQFVQRIEDQADRLHQLILDLLSLARIESGEQAFEIVDVDMREAVEMCLEEYRQSAEAKSITVRTEPPAEDVIVRADEEAVRQILENLVNNAIKYTPAEGEVVVRWHRDRGYALIEVRDTGIGIEPEHQDRLFERFYRVDKARSRELGGTGLGLSIVKHLTQFFGGSVSVRSEVARAVRSRYDCPFPIDADQLCDRNNSLGWPLASELSPREPRRPSPVSS
jgi:two-component system, OmpR family, phosphate regulon sensor histidine kinase PhoR